MEVMWAMAGRQPLKQAGQTTEVGSPCVVPVHVSSAIVFY